MKNQLQIVTLNQAIILKELGFDWEVDRYYALVTDYHYQWEKGRIYRNSCVNNVPEVASCPTVALALKWFRDAKNIRTEIRESRSFTNKYICSYRTEDGLFFSTGLGDGKVIPTYDDAECELLNGLLTLKSW